MNFKRLTIKGEEKIGLINNLSTMLAAGIPILEAVTSILEESKGGSKKILETLHSDLVEGNRIHTTFAKFPRVFSTVTTNLVRASEESGTLEVTLKDIQKGIQKEMEFSDKVTSALIYPALVMVVFAGVLLTILIVVIPKISTVFSRLNVDLPLPTRVMIFLSDAILNYSLPIGVGAVAAVLLLIFFYRSQRELVLGVLFSLPLISKLIKEIDMTRFSRSMYLLLNSGLPISAALELSRTVVLKREISRLIEKALEMVMAGRPLSEGLASKGSLMPRMMLKLIEVGERSGTLAESMRDISEHLDYKVTKNLKTTTALLEPAMLVFVGIAVGGMMLAVISPIYGLIGNVGAGVR